MTSIREVNSLTEEGLGPYRTLRRTADHLRDGIFVAEGELVVRRLIESGLEIVSLLLTPEWHERLAPQIEVLPSRRGQSRPEDGPTIFIAGKPLLESIVGFNLHQGIMAVGRVPEEPALDAVLQDAPHPLLLAALDGLVNAENVGVIVRNCAALGAGAVIVDARAGSPYLRRAVRNSMGAVFRLPVLHVPSLPSTLGSLRREYGIRVVAACLQDAEPLEQADLSGDVCIVFGNEGDGISEQVLRECTIRVAIPMENNVDSLNVASASSVFLYEVRKQGRAGSQRSPG